MEEAPSSGETLEQIRPSRWPLIVGVLVVLAGAGIGLAVLFAHMATASRAREARAWATLQRCLVGEAPLASGEAPSARLRRIQLTAVGIPWRAKGQDAWPGWCSSRAHALHEALREAGHEQAGAKDLGYWADHLGKELHDHPYPETDVGVVADFLWAAGRASGLPPSEADDVPPVPAPAQALTLDALRGLTPVSAAAFPLRLVSDERVPTEPMRLLVVGEQAARAPYLCTAHAGADVLTCATLPPALEHVQARLLGAAEEGAAPLLFAAPEGEAGIYRAADGSLFDEVASYGGFVRADGFAAELSWDRAHGQFRLRRGLPGQPPRDARFKLDGVDDDRQVALLWDAVVWAANGSVSVRHLLDGDAPLAAPAVVATVPEGGLASGAPLLACKTPQALTLLVRGEEKDTVTLDTGERWSTPISYDAVEGRVETLTCQGTTASFTALRAVNESGWVEGSVTQVRCSPGQCDTQTTELAKVFPDVKETMPVRIGAAALGGKLLLVWQAGTVGALRLRLAPQEKIEEPADVVLYDDLMEGGAVVPTSNLLGWALFARGTYAVVLLSTTAGVHAVRVDEAGKVSPMTVEWK